MRACGRISANGGYRVVPRSFVSVTDVAALVVHVLADPAARGRIIEIGGPADLTFNQLAAAIQAAAGRTSAPRHVPRPVLRLAAGALGLA
jgi:nucleoside-diphosphate-sugar epimerase